MLMIGIAAFVLMQTSVANPAQKVAYLDLERVVQTCGEGKQRLSELQTFVEAKRAEIDKLSKAVAALRTQYDTQSTKLTDEARLELEDRMEAEEVAFRRAQEDAEKQAERWRTRAFNFIRARLETIVAKVAAERGLSAVRYRSQFDAWIDPSQDITAELVMIYDATYPAKQAKP